MKNIPSPKLGLGKRFDFYRTEPNKLNSVWFGSKAKNWIVWNYKNDRFTLGSVQNRIEPKNWSVQSNYLQIILMKNLKGQISNSLFWNLNFVTLILKPKVQNPAIIGDLVCPSPDRWLAASPWVSRLTVSSGTTLQAWWHRHELGLLWLTTLISHAFMNSVLRG